jgi:ribosomal protein S26
MAKTHYVDGTGVFHRVERLYSRGRKKDFHSVPFFYCIECKMTIPEDKVYTM